MERSPEWASTLGDKRWNDKISDYSARAENMHLAENQVFMMRLAAIDPTGLSDADKTSRDMLRRNLEEEQQGAEFKEWEMPMDQMHGIYGTYPDLAYHLKFSDVKDYDDWIARLKQIPTAFDEVMANMSAGMQDHRVPPKYLLEQTLGQVQQLANQKPDESPMAAPLKKFPASISPA
jgi:uncharacterized protein (DUF885 family)